MNTSILEETARALSDLKDFQLETVNHVHSRLFAQDASKRFLVADEVGLGKTLIARGVVARAIETLHDKVDRVDVVYICSNSEIARQNLNKLKFESGHAALDTRLTLLPKHIAQLKQSKARLNFVAFTPATSFDLKEGLGRKEERALLLQMIQHLWRLGSRAAAVNVMAGNSGVDSFRSMLQASSLEENDPGFTSTEALGLAIARSDAAQPNPELRLRATFERLCEAYPRSDTRASKEASVERTRFVGQLRALLAGACLRSLEPDVIVLDEFQRFSHLLDPSDGEAQLAQELFSLNDARVLLLSATPYRMYTPPGEASGEDHYEDFVRTVNFLENSKGADSLGAMLGEYRTAMLELGLTRDSGRLRAAARALEARLRKVMVRTERLGATTDRNGMLTHIDSGPAPVTKTDALGYVAVSRIARAVEHHDPIEYWKSAPYFLNFMESDYALTQRLDGARSDPATRQEIAKALESPGHHRIDVSAFDGNLPIDPGNGRMRQLFDQTIGQGAHRLLWLPPALAYYRLEGAHADPRLKGFTKRLVFTSWRFVPRAIAGLLSFEAERQMHGATRRKAKASLLRFARVEGRPTGMPVLALMYPSSYLARACDPLRLSRELGTATPSAAEVLELAREQIDIALAKLKEKENVDQPVDQRWYWAAPLLLDQSRDREATTAWFANPRLAADWSNAGAAVEGEETPEVDLGWERHVEVAREMLADEGRSLGRRPDDLTQVLAEFAVGGPGACLLRSMLRVVGMTTHQLSEKTGRDIRTAAASAAWAFRALYNQPEVTQLLQRELGATAEEGEDTYWRVVLRYGVAGCLQAVLDEYAHVLRDHVGAGRGPKEERVHEIANDIRAALSLRAATVTVRDVRPSAGGRTFERGDDHRVRCHFAIRYGDQKQEDGSVASRSDLVRKAFNSPFWPFVLATTSVGQEGLDFHPYCHAVVHWNLPSNPVDLEQREGRVHRYKGHAVRKNIAQRYVGHVATTEGVDAWDELFSIARQQKPAGSTDIVPFWVFPEGDARIERHVLALPSSRELDATHQLLRALALYRMVFGQPRQEDMLRFLREQLPDADLSVLLETTGINLAPNAS